MSDQPGRWYGESDGDTHNKTFYAYRENSAFPGGVERKDFDTRAQLNNFLSTMETPIIQPTRHDFPEDFQSPNVERGIYHNTCRKCNADIMGGKYRRLCKVCFDAAVEKVEQSRKTTYSPPVPSPEDQKIWPCRFMLFSTTKNEVQSIIREWKGTLSERPVEQMKLDIEDTVDKCFEHLKNCTVRVDVLSYNSLRNTWPIHTTYDSHTRTWSR